MYLPHHSLFAVVVIIESIIEIGIVDISVLKEVRVVEHQMFGRNSLTCMQHVGTTKLGPGAVKHQIESTGQ